MKTSVAIKKVPAPGFSLVEMLVVIAVVGIITTIAIPQVGSMNASAQASSASRNAQEIALIYQSGLSDGVVWAATDVATAINAVKNGGNGTDGVFFALKGLDAAAITAASAKLAWNASAGLVYNP